MPGLTQWKGQKKHRRMAVLQAGEKTRCAIFSDETGFTCAFGAAGETCKKTLLRRQARLLDSERSWGSETMSATGREARMIEQPGQERCAPFWA